MKKKILIYIFLIFFSTLIRSSTYTMYNKTYKDLYNKQIDLNKKVNDFTLVKEEIELEMMGCRTTANSDWNNMLIFKEYEKMTNVKVKFIAIPENNYRESLSLSLAGNQLPDAYIKGFLEPMDVAEYSQNGTLIPLDDLIEKYAPNFKKLMYEYPEVKAACYSADGHIYALPAIVTLDAALSDKHWINKKWLEKSGINPPITTDELKKVLEIFKNNDMNGNGNLNDEIPMTGENIEQIIDNFSGAFGLQKQMMYDINIDNDRVEIWYGSDKYKKLLQYLADLYKKGLIDKDIFFSQYKDFFSKINPDRVGVFHNQTDDIFSQYSDCFISLEPWRGPAGDQIKNRRPIARDYGAFAITKENKYPEITMRWIDYFYSKEGSLFFRMGIEGDTYIKNDSGIYDYTEKIKNDPRGLSLTIGELTMWPGRGAPHWINEENSVAINSAKTKEAQKKLEPYLIEKVIARPLFSIESEMKIRNIRNNLDLYVEASREKFITGVFSFDKWDEYKNVLEKLGIRELESIYQNAYSNIKE